MPTASRGRGFRQGPPKNPHVVEAVQGRDGIEHVADGSRSVRWLDQGPKLSGYFLRIKRLLRPTARHISLGD
jgi:hypothetical protein